MVQEFPGINKEVEEYDRGIEDKQETNRGAPDTVPIATVFLHVTRGLPFVILCLRIYEGGWEGKGTFNCHHWHLFDHCTIIKYISITMT